MVREWTVFGKTHRVPDTECVNYHRVVKLNFYTVLA